MNAKLIELKNDSMKLIRSAGKISRIEYLTRMEAMARKWDGFIIATSPPDCATFAEEKWKLEQYFHKQGLDLEEIPDQGPILERKMPN